MSAQSSPPTYLCQRCGNCCRWPGVVRVSEPEIEKIATFLAMKPLDFIDKYCEVTYDRRGLTLIMKESDGSCIFLEGKNVCQIQPVKPIQCSGFPNTWNFPGWQESCEAKWDEKATHAP
jgi:uncharacterized protein